MLPLKLLHGHRVSIARRTAAISERSFATLGSVPVRHVSFPAHAPAGTKSSTSTNN